MSLSLILILLLPLFVIPAFFLPQNRLRFYTICSLIATGIVVTINLLNLFLSSLNIEGNMGKFFYPMFSFLLNRNTLANASIYHLSFWLTNLLIYFLSYLLTYLIIKFHFIGKNPDIHKVVTKFTKAINILLFLVSTYVVLGVFLIEIREILPVQEGNLSWLFALIYPLEA